ncbi:hypothetical protein MTO98_09485 [Mucilaginibacter sp. SMC90]|uniref:hypothetical protein n=1 Tax=Mucilaginibacter sp. SMC90 TaxID=2929803 RepID=UPI001FB20677|nr:hypothetical protein [Mucilaginibacter sp. SMC90]UOE51309.1 hypothetical protein MTO98_09485 [Mucilaginibacter sp. SMC90]
MENNQMMSVLYDALLASPGMNELVKIDLKVSRKQVLLLGQVMEAGLTNNSPETSGLLSAMPEGSAKELMEVIQQCMGKAELTELSQKLKSLTAAKNK